MKDSLPVPLQSVNDGEKSNPVHSHTRVEEVNIGHPSTSSSIPVVAPTNGDKGKRKATVVDEGEDASGWDDLFSRSDDEESDGSNEEGDEELRRLAEAAYFIELARKVHWAKEAQDEDIRLTPFIHAPDSPADLVMRRIYERMTSNDPSLLALLRKWPTRQDILAGKFETLVSVSTLLYMSF